MPRYIDADNIKLKGISMFDQNLEILIPLSDVRKSLQMTPTADVQKVRHGKWIRGNYVCGEYEFKCSVCGNTEWHTSYSTPFCPHCGARMDLDENEYR